MNFHQLFLLGFALITYSGSQNLKNKPYRLFLMRHISPKITYPVFFDNLIEQAPKNGFYSELEADVSNGRGAAYDLNGFDSQPELRSNNRIRPSTITQRLEAEQRFLFSMLNYPYGLFGFLRPQTSSITNPFVTTTTLISTITTPIASFCIPQDQFVTGANKAISTTPCSPQRKRSFPKDVHSAPLKITATRVAEMDTTKLPASIVDIRNREISVTSPDKELTSSKEEASYESNDALHRKPRQFNNMILTTTSTQYVFISTIFKKTLSVAAINQLSCLPAGILVC